MPPDPSWLHYAAAAGLALAGLGYCAVHWHAARCRQVALVSREPQPLAVMVGELPEPLRPTAAAVLACLAAALGVPPETLRLSDRFRVEYRLKWQQFLLDEFDEEFGQRLRARLGPGFRWPPRRALRNCPDVRALIHVLHGVCGPADTHARPQRRTDPEV